MTVSYEKAVEKAAGQKAAGLGAKLAGCGFLLACFLAPELAYAAEP